MCQWISSWTSGAAYISDHFVLRRRKFKDQFLHLCWVFVTSLWFGKRKKTNFLVYALSHYGPTVCLSICCRLCSCLLHVPHLPLVSLVTDEACPSQRGKSARLLDTNVPIRGNANTAPGCISVIQHSTLNISQQMATLNSSRQQLSIYLFLMPSVCFAVTPRLPQLNLPQSAGRHWLYRFHCLKILPPPEDRSGVSLSQYFL